MVTIAVFAIKFEFVVTVVSTHPFKQVKIADRHSWNSPMTNTKLTPSMRCFTCSAKEHLT